MRLSKMSSMAKALLIALLSVSRLSLVHGWAKEMVTDEGCAKESTEGSVLMNDYAVIDNDAYVTVERDGVEIESGSTYTSGESLTVSFSTSNQFIIETKSATFADGYCENTRVMDSDSEVVMPSDGSTVYLWAASAGGYNAVTVTNLFTLTASQSEENEEETDAEETAADVFEEESNSDADEVMSDPTMYPSEGVPTHYPSAEPEDNEEAESEAEDNEELSYVEREEAEADPEEATADESEDVDEITSEDMNEEETEVDEVNPTMYPSEGVPTHYPSPEPVDGSEGTEETESEDNEELSDVESEEAEADADEATADEVEDVEEIATEDMDEETADPTQYPTEGVPTHYPSSEPVYDSEDTEEIEVEDVVDTYTAIIETWEWVSEPTFAPTTLTLYPTAGNPTHHPTDAHPTKYPSKYGPSAEPTLVPTAPTHYPTEAQPTVWPTKPPVFDDDNDDTLSTVDVYNPNIVFIIADDLGYNSLGYSDESKAFLTPRLTEMAKSGIIMSNFYTQEVCTPSRGSLLTGRYPLSMGMQYGMVQPTSAWGMTIGETTIAEVLKADGYSTHILGKWHLGFFSPLLLPTARGFDSFLGYLNGENYPWSKRNPDLPAFVDLVTMNDTCFMEYDGDDIHDYSTTFYTNHALDIIEEHDTSKPMFLVLSYQAVHDPFVDIGKHRKGMPDHYIPDDVLESIKNDIVGSIPQEYMKSLYLLDDAVGQVVDKLDEKEMLDNTLIVFVSDNGGCMYGGGKNYPLRGTKGSLFEGGTKVESFFYSPLLKPKLRGITYDGLMHISDWFPTVLSLANINFSPDSEYTLDGVNQTLGWLGKSTPRTDMLYNMHVDVSGIAFNIFYNGSVAVRNERYKLLHTFDDDTFGTWYETEVEYDFDVNVTNPDGNRCNQENLSGNFTYFLFDLQEDPYEQNNLYDSDDEEIIAVKDALYDLIPKYEAKATMKVKRPQEVAAQIKKIWEEDYDWHIMPYIDWSNPGWESKISYRYGTLSYPDYCSNDKEVFFSAMKSIK